MRPREIGLHGALHARRRQPSGLLGAGHEGDEGAGGGRVGGLGRDRGGIGAGMQDRRGQQADNVHAPIGGHFADIGHHQLGLAVGHVLSGQGADRAEAGLGGHSLGDAQLFEQGFQIDSRGRAQGRVRIDDRARGQHRGLELIDSGDVRLCGAGLDRHAQHRIGQGRGFGGIGQPLRLQGGQALDRDHHHIGVLARAQALLQDAGCARNKGQGVTGGFCEVGAGGLERFQH